MRWSEIRGAHPDRWAVVEILAAEEADRCLQPTDLAVVALFDDGMAALTRYRQLHLDHPARSYLFVHTSRERLEVEVVDWVGIRPSHAS